MASRRSRKASVVDPPAGAADAKYRERQRLRLLDAAERIVAKEGLSALQARRVAKEADCAVGTVYNIFGDLDGLAVAINGRTLAEFGQMADAALRRSDEGTLEQRLMALALAYLDFAIAHRLRLKAVFDHNLADPEGEVSAAYRADQNRLFALVEKALHDFVPNRRERATAARAMFAAVHGIVLMAVDRKLGPFDAAAADRQVRFVVNAMARGVAHSQQPAPAREME